MLLSLWLQPSQVWRWRKSRGDISYPLAENWESLHTGRVSILLGMEEELLRWFFSFVSKASWFLFIYSPWGFATSVQHSEGRHRAPNDMTVLSFKQDCTSRCDTWMSASSRAASKRGPWFHWVRKEENCWAKPTSSICDQHGSDTHKLWHVEWEDT